MMPTNDDPKTANRSARNQSKRNAEQRKSDHNREQARQRRHTEMARAATLTQQADRASEDNKHYAQLVTAVGYGGFFTLWVYAKDGMPPALAAGAGACIAASIVFFIGFELYKAFVVGLAYQRYRKGKSNLLDAQMEIDAINDHWLWTFSLATIFGLAGGLSTLGWYVINSVLLAAA
ncbi:hypothetical protein [Arenimonas aestuarii]